MTLARRTVLSCGAIALAAPSLAHAAPVPAAAAYEAQSGGHIGFHAENLTSGATLAWRADERFVLCSTFKASLAACVLQRVDQGRDGLAQMIRYRAADVPDWHAPVAQANLAKAGLSVAEMSVGEMCRAAVEQSDNTCASLLLTRIGGPSAMTAFWRQLGDQVTRLDDPEPALNRTPAGGVRNTTTPAAMASTLRRLVLGNVLSVAGRGTLTQWLVGCQTGQRRLRAGLPAHWVIGDKTGNNGVDAAGDIAVAWTAPGRPMVLSVYTRGGSPTPRQLDDAFAGIGRAVAARLA